jgi:hypothetical protein
MMKKTIVLLGMATLMLVTGLFVAAGLSRAEEYAYTRGYSDAVAYAHYEHGHGYDSSCPSGHSEAYCHNYQSGYATGWRSVTTTQTQGGGQMSETIKGPNGIQGTAPPSSNGTSNATSLPPPSTSTTNSTTPPSSNGTSNATSLPPPSTSTKLSHHRHLTLQHLMRPLLLPILLQIGRLVYLLLSSSLLFSSFMQYRN